ncbi:GGDEF domain-containing protein [Paraburkholderia sp. J12]|uniref:GGDEF domain-containing protein n=1 Tax=Paraburkholderia sp. J12 TaxID=2805432 RepID=UPI002ABE79E9|nr:GGDEF domain-containing protein [Paraburkholderia sp. J12]
MFSPIALFGILIVSCLMSVAILGSLHRAAMPGIGRWCVGYALFAVASSAIIMAGDRPHPPAIIAISFVAFVAVLVLVQGTRQFFGLRPVRYAELAAFVLVCAALVYFTYVSPSSESRVVLISIAMAYGRIAVGTLVLRHTPREGARYACRFVTAAAYLGAGVHIVRVLAVVLGAAPSVTFLQPSPWNVLLLGVAIVSFPCMSIGLVMLAHDRIVKKMEHLATIDELTGAHMRRAFMARANTLLSRALLTGKPLSIAILDIDNFKAVNDGFGHAIGDRVLTRVASAVLSQLRPCDLFGRLGGEEFAIVFVNARKNEAAALTDALRLAVEHSPGDGPRCTLSAGVDRVVPDDTLERAMARADAALYAAKAMGRNRVVTATESELRDVA